MQTSWQIKESSDALEFNTGLLDGVGISNIILRLLANREIDTPEKINKFINPSLVDLYPPQLFVGLEKTRERIRIAAKNNEKILIHGDYDVDGLTSTAILCKTFDMLGVSYITWVPDRLKHGYGFSKEAVRYAEENGVSIILAVDCGISAVAEVELANSLGMEVIIVDHHKPPHKLPSAYSIINSLQDECPYPFSELAAVGLAYKLAYSLIGDKADEFLDLVALGTISDVAPLVDENRIMVKYGLERINNTKRHGIHALCEVAGLRKKVGSGHVGFILGPRINAGGRVGSADASLRLLVSENEREVRSIAHALNEENKERQRLERKILKEALLKVENEVNFNQDWVIVLWSKDWHPGVIGIVASRLADKFNRPAIVISLEKGVGKGSGRSIKNFNLFEAIKANEDLLLEYGGHTNAAGVLIAEAKLDSFRKGINRKAHDLIRREDLVRSIKVDMEINFGDLNKEFMNELELLEPYGCGNPRPVFLTRKIVAKSKPAYFNTNNLKVWITDGKFTFEAVWYNVPDVNLDLTKNHDILYSPQLKYLGGVPYIVLDIKDLKPSEY